MENTVPFRMHLWFKSEGWRSKTQLFVSNYLLSIVRPHIKARTFTQKRTFSGVNCWGSHSRHEGASKSTVVGAIKTTKVGINLKLIPCIGKGANCIQNVRSLCIRPQRNLVVRQL